MRMEKKKWNYWFYSPFLFFDYIGNDNLWSNQYINCVEKSDYCKWPLGNDILEDLELNICFLDCFYVTSKFTS
jgi:hypothetical protein